ncbi:MAG: hypothetical protein A3I44_02390 [Candidatus Sungbacteria bacterium RIFCSPLOWO2_02_FULL_51_17]|uniref:DUF4382 domain-containing protein n=1 Tax=Candidatus Sungbacteria bacterium RIFCSPHIGHO2_02_FULL_51_29 TaxID=1802273 RepID=A0A1G2KSF7_9BACT|nr:MAG: hypothetical protein A3C16_02275 [Candidatus Sungbacteria bacterium RIFCSPHIGHO2_02_FULL_51_29]OHA05000.1 MAG: hypothetical protein A3B29_01555 [Candidatus Sungbacteria bacterium RIFCSPLOWO2_01_FULL_51_34]OHA11888.1 MAG: hypothetical protein A3I44_02390 [Candidatus Sungbacteria bacterium RIFCSPLOWO2_02_FULL_51_17]
MKYIFSIGAVALVLLIGFFAYLGSTNEAVAPGNSGVTDMAGTGVEGVVKSGRVVFAITDAAASLGDIESVLITVTEVRAHSSARGWITVSEENKQFDLLKLKQSDSIALLADVALEVGTYDQVRFSVKNVLVSDKAGVSKSAKLPSGDLKLMGKFTVEDGKTSSVVADFLVDRSLHVAGKGGYIFAPVIKLESRTGTDVAVAGGLVDIRGGAIETDMTVGMNENGEVGVDTKLDAAVNYEIVGDVIRVKVKGETDAGVKVTANAAIAAAGDLGYIDMPLSVKMVTEDGKKAWLVVGTKGLDVVVVHIDTMTGVVIKSE